MTRSRDFAQGATRTEFIYTATADQTSFSGNDTNSVSLAYTAGQIDVYLNGSRLAPADYTATNGTAVVLGVGAEASDTLQINAFGTFNVANVVATRDLEGNEFVLDDDGDTSITADTDDQIDIKVGGTDLAKLTDGQLTLTSATASRPGILLESTNADANPPFLRFQKNGSSPADNDEVGVIQFYADDDGGNVFVPAQIKVLTSDVTNGSEDGIITIATTGGGTLAERLRIGSTGEILLGKTSNGFTVAGGCYNDTGAKNGSLELIMDGGVALALNRLSDNGSTVTFHQDSTGVGSIGVTGSNTSFNTSSDYRLKENVDYSWDATTRLKQLKPARFNFIKDDTNTLQDGFLAHEVSSIVPEAITGAKDATIDIDVVKNASGKIISCTTMDTSEQAWIEGKDDEIFPSDSTWHENETVPDYQNIDHSKLVPLLVKTIQELEARIKTLEDA